MQKAQLQRYETLTEENDRLRSLLDGAEGQVFEYRFAELVRVDLDPFSHRVLIDRGSSDGVTVGQAVIDGQGVMGQVEDVHLHFSTVRLISDPNHALPVQINRTGLRSVAFGSGETGNLVLNSVPREADVREGDLIVTSGLGSRFPSGYPVARVAGINREEGLTFAVVEASPLAALDRGREVLLIVPPPEAESEDPDEAIIVTEDGITEAAGDNAQPEGGDAETADDSSEPEPDSTETPQ